jgi:hypothetical protein
MPCVNKSPERLAGVEGREDPGVGTGNSPRLTFFRTRSSSSTRASAASVRDRSRSTCSRRTASRWSARSLTVAHSCSTFSTIALDCASRASIISMSRRNPATSLVYVASCSAIRVLRSCTRASDWVSCWDCALCALRRALSVPSVEAFASRSASYADCSCAKAACLSWRYLAKSSDFFTSSLEVRSASSLASCSCWVRESSLN